ncbi:MAG: hypothetical protein KDJ52_08110 [Anaerolineae bacterium]|nr:hypothetical protein [Anaerolineae bacterium]
MWTTPSPQLNNTARLTLQNIPLQDEKLLIVNVNLADVSDMYGAELQVRYNPAQLKVRDNDTRLDGIQIKPGPLIAFDNRFVVQNMADPETGTVDFAFTLLRSATPIEGEGVLATIVFEILGSGPYTLDFGDVQLVSSRFEAIPVETEGLVIDTGTEAGSGETGSTASNQIGLTVVVGGGLILSVILLVILSLRLSGGRVPATPSPAARRMPGASGFSTRSSALLSQQGIRAMDQGHTMQAYELFSQAIELDPANVEAWLGKGLVAQQETEKRICLQRVLALDPDNATAKTVLQQLHDRPKS